MILVGVYNNDELNDIWFDKQAEGYVAVLSYPDSGMFGSCCITRMGERIPYGYSKNTKFFKDSLKARQEYQRATYDDVSWPNVAFGAGFSYDSYGIQ